MEVTVRAVAPAKHSSLKKNGSIKKLVVIKDWGIKDPPDGVERGVI